MNTCHILIETTIPIGSERLLLFVISLHPGEGLRCHAQIGGNRSLRSDALDFGIIFQQMLILTVVVRALQHPEAFPGLSVVLIQDEPIQNVGVGEIAKHFLHRFEAYTDQVTWHQELNDFQRGSLVDETFECHDDLPFLPEILRYLALPVQGIRHGKSIAQIVQMGGNLRDLQQHVTGGKGCGDQVISEIRFQPIGQRMKGFKVGDQIFHI